MHPKWAATKPFACYHLKEPISSRDVPELPPQLRCHSKGEMRTFNAPLGCSRLDQWFWRYETNSAEHANMRTVLLLTVLDARVSRGKVQYLVKWKGYPTGENTWLTEQELENAPEILQEYKDAHGLD